MIESIYPHLLNIDDIKLLISLKEDQRHLFDLKQFVAYGPLKK